MIALFRACRFFFSDLHSTGSLVPVTSIASDSTASDSSSPLATAERTFYLFCSFSSLSTSVKRSYV